MTSVLVKDPRSRDHAGFVKRWVADLLDGIATTVLAFVAYLIGDRLILGRPGGFMDEEGPLGIADAVVVAFLLWNSTWLVGRTGQSVGRMLAGITVVGEDGGAIGFWRALGRNLFATFISAPLLYLGFLWVIWDVDKQAWHDKAFRTYVVKDQLDPVRD